MTHNRKRTISLLTALIIFTLAFTNFVLAAPDGEIALISEKGGLESAYVTWSSYQGADSYNVYSKKSGGEYVKLDAPLTREYQTYCRADALGLSAGEYTLKVAAVKDGAEIAEAETGTLTVLPHVREGFAFSENSPYKAANGAYNADGTLRADADVLYVTNGNKDNVMLNDDPELGVGLTAILAYRQAKKISTPLAIRLIGKIDEPSGMTIHTAQFQNTGNTTLEGVGDDATIYGWIMTLKRATNFEIRNIGMMYGGEGTTGSAIVLDTDNKNVWIHNMDFFYGAPGKDADQKKGDGAVDLKSRSDYVTISYNHFWDLGKTCVSGGPWENSNMYSDEAKIFVTYHHNWFDHTDSRHPRCVVGTNHVYNNYYDGNAMYGIGAAMKTSVFSEANYYRNVPRPMIIASQGGDMWNGTDYTGGDNKKGTLSGQMGGMIKSYGDVMVTPSHFYAYGEEDVTGEFDAYVAQSRDEKVPETVQAKLGDENGKGIYNNFDTDPQIMYSYSVDTAEEAVEKVKAYAGRSNGGDFKWTFNNETDDSFHDIDVDLLTAIKSYRSKLVKVGGGLPVVAPLTPSTPAPTTEPTTAPSAAPSGDNGVALMPAGTTTWAKDWNNGQGMSADNVSADGYVKCYKGNNNSYKTNAFSADGETATRGYQMKNLTSRSFMIQPKEECDVVIYFYSSGNRRLGVYTTADESSPAGTFTPERSGDFSYTYHYTETGSPLYIAGLDGDIYLAGISLIGGGSLAEASEPIKTVYDQYAGSPAVAFTSDITAGKTAITGLKWSVTAGSKTAEAAYEAPTISAGATVSCGLIVVLESGEVDADDVTAELKATAE